MRNKCLLVVLASVFAILVVSSRQPTAAKADDAGKGRRPDKQHPVHATDVELVKKMTLKGPPEWAKGGKGDKKVQAATGELGEAISEERYAVVVGISDYPGTGNDLNYSDDDASEMAEALIDVYDFTNVTLLTDLDANRANILSAIEAIPTDAGEIVFFFSGHGMKGVADDGDRERIDEAIVAHNGTDALVPIWDGELKEAFAGFTAARIVFIFDTCLAGGMKDDLEAANRVIAMATTETGLAYESSAWQNGEFSYYLIDQGILLGKANTHDYNVNSVVGEPRQVTAEEAFDYAKAKCSYDKPTIGDSFENDLLP